MKHSMIKPPKSSKYFNLSDKLIRIIFLVIIILHFIAINTLYPIYKNDIFKINLIPIIYAAFFFGFKRGFLVMLGIDIFLFSYLNLNRVPIQSYYRLAITGSILGFIMVIVFSKLAKMYRKMLDLNEELKEISLSDSLTGLYNRRYFKEVVINFADNFLEEATNVEVWKRDHHINNKVIGICIIDIDFFKKINDTYGHEVGDIVLKEISLTLKSLVRFDDIVIRWGGEEFIILLNRTNIDYLPQFLRLLKTTIMNHKILMKNNQSINITVSGGCIAYPYNKNNPMMISFEECINLSDILLYFAKNTGRNRLIMLKSTEKFSSYTELADFLKLVEKNGFDLNNQLFEVV